MPVHVTGNGISDTGKWAVMRNGTVKPLSEVNFFAEYDDILEFLTGDPVRNLCYAAKLLAEREEDVDVR